MTRQAEKSDEAYMRQALKLGRFGLGNTAPNPAVGCVLVSAEGHVVGTGITGQGGRPHAEALALAEAGDKAHGATAYVTLEPCAHQGKTPPCAQALIDAQVARVVYAIDDPDPRVDGRGARRQIFQSFDGRFSRIMHQPLFFGTRCQLAVGWQITFAHYHRHGRRRFQSRQAAIKRRVIIAQCAAAGDNRIMPGP